MINDTSNKEGSSSSSPIILTKVNALIHIHIYVYICVYIYTYTLPDFNNGIENFRGNYRM
jgi:hypothetical protein